MFDIENLGKLKALEANAPEAMNAFWAFDKAALTAGSISRKHKELIALAVAFTTQCPYCIALHAKKAREADATEQELAEVVAITAALRAGATITHGTHAMPYPVIISAIEQSSTRASYTPSGSSPSKTMI